MPSCTVCAHPEREQIDLALVAGKSNRATARQYALHKDAVLRHKASHVSSALQAVTAARTTEAAQTALDRLEELFTRVGNVLRAAEIEGKPSLVLQAAREMRQTAEVLAKITGELDERNSVQVLNVTADPGWLATRAAMLEALAPHPEAAAAVSVRLLALEAGEPNVITPDP